MNFTAESSKSPTELDVSLGYVLLRLTLGINIAGHGISRILSGTAGFAAALAGQFRGTPLPGFAVSAFAHALPWLETLIGLLILFGVATRWALALGALLMAVLTLGVTLRQDWETAGWQLVYAVVYFILLSFCRYNWLSFDGWLRKQRYQRQI